MLSQRRLLALVWLAVFMICPAAAFPGAAAAAVLGDLEVVVGSEGARDGGGPCTILRPVPSKRPMQHQEPVLLPEDPEPDPELSLEEPSSNQPVIRRTATASAVRFARAPAIPILLFTQRQNE